jgi:hypothetical protein
MGGFWDKESMAKMEPYTFSGTWAGPKATWEADYYEGFSRFHVTARGERMQMASSSAISSRNVRGAFVLSRGQTFCRLSS